MSFAVELSKAAKKELRKLPADDTRRVQATLALLSENPYPPNALKLVGRTEWRVRVGRLRILYLVDSESEQIAVYSIEDRSNVYKKR